MSALVFRELLALDTAQDFNKVELATRVALRPTVIHAIISEIGSADKTNTWRLPPEHID